MDDANARLAAQVIGQESYVRQAGEAERQRQRALCDLLSQRRLPAEPWSDAQITWLLSVLSGMDSNNFPANAGAGEREARVFSPLVAQRHFHLAHGVGRSGDVAATQPKAAGSSLLAKLCNALALDALREAGAVNTAAAYVVPLATGMSLSLALQTLCQTRPASARYVVWSRIDQKTCLKCVRAAGLDAIVVPLRRDPDHPDQLITDVDGVRAAIERVGADSVVAILSTTSCFAPRAADDVAALAALAKSAGVGHVINNAYGVQVGSCMEAVRQAMAKGRVDAYVQSTDKNFLVPVGGAVIAGRNRQFLADVAALYPGRASNAPAVDLFVTLLSMGRCGWKRLLSDRKDGFAHLRQSLSALASRLGERVLTTPGNGISVAVSVQRLDAHAHTATSLGAALWTRMVSGTRVVSRDAGAKDVAGHSFPRYGGHADDIPISYITAACAIGATQRDVDFLLTRLERAYLQLAGEIAAAADDASQTQAGASAGASGGKDDREVDKLEVEEAEGEAAEPELNALGLPNLKWRTLPEMPPHQRSQTDELNARLLRAVRDSLRDKLAGMSLPDDVDDKESQAAFQDDDEQVKDYEAARQAREEAGEPGESAGPGEDEGTADESATSTQQATADQATVVADAPEPDELLPTSRTDRVTESVAKFYDCLAPDYRGVHKDWAGSVRVQGEILGDILSAHLVSAPARVLDCACGVGTQALGLAKQGYSVVASDLSRASLAQAEAAETVMLRGGSGIKWIPADFRELPLRVPDEGTYDAVICADNSIAHMGSAADLSAALASMSSMLRSGGLLILTVRDYDAMLALTERPTSTPIRQKHDTVMFQLWQWVSDSPPVYQNMMYVIKQGAVSILRTLSRAWRRQEIVDAAAALPDDKALSLVETRFPSEHASSSFYQPVLVFRKHS